MTWFDNLKKNIKDEKAEEKKRQKQEGLDSENREAEARLRKANFLAAHKRQADLVEKEVLGPLKRPRSGFKVSSRSYDVDIVIWRHPIPLPTESKYVGAFLSTYTHSEGDSEGGASYEEECLMAPTISWTIYSLPKSGYTFRFQISLLALNNGQYEYRLWTSVEGGSSTRVETVSTSKSESIESLTEDLKQAIKPLLADS